MANGAHDIHIVTEYLPPLQVAESGDQIHGLTVDLFKAVVDDTEYSYTTSVYPWARSYRLATSGANVLIFPLIRTKERENKFHWIGKLWSFTGSIYRHAERKDIELATLDDAKKYSISVYRDDFFHQYLIKNSFSPWRVFPQSSIDKSLAQFVNKRVELIIIDSSLLEYYVKKHGLRLDDYQKILTLDNLKVRDTYMALSKETSPEVVKQFRDSYVRVSGENKYLVINN